MIDEKFRVAVQGFWEIRASQTERQVLRGNKDTGARGAVTGGGQMSPIEKLVANELMAGGLDAAHVFRNKALELPGYYRPEKKWDLLVVKDGKLVCAIEFKSHVGPSFGNNANNRAEEAIGNATDIWTAYRLGLFQESPRPVLGFFCLLEDIDAVHKPVRLQEPHFPCDPVFKAASYARRYELLCRRLLRERQYDCACLTLASNEVKTRVSHPEGLSFERFIEELKALVKRFA